MPVRILDPVTHFWSRVDKRGPDECWPWTGAPVGGKEGGYGAAWWKDELHRAHRVAYLLTHGVWPLVGRHTCDNPPCCNSKHLLDGTKGDNVADMHERGRARKATKLTQTQVDEIRASSKRVVELARLYGVSHSTVSAIRNYKSRRNATP